MSFGLELMDIIEAYLSLNLLVAVGMLAAPAFTKVPAAKGLRLARLALLACLAAPVGMMFLTPAHGPVISAAFDIDSVLPTVNETTVADPTPMAVSPEPSIGPSMPDLKTALGYLITFGFLLGIVIHLTRLLRDATAVNALVRRAVSMKQVGKLRISVSTECAVPFSVRLWRAHVVLPASILTDQRATAMAIAHEAQHHRQGDCLAAYAVEILRAVCFWNPFVHRWARVLNHLQEFSCDEALIGRRRFTPHEYGSCLFNVAQAAVSLEASNREFACAPGMTCGERDKPQSLLFRRIDMLSSYVHSSAISLSRKSRFLSSLVATFVVAVPLGVSFAARGTIAGVDPVAAADMNERDFDPRIQTIAASEVQSAMNRYRAKSAAALVMDPSTGRVLAFAEEHDNVWQESWATRTLTPASTVKPFVLAGAIESGVASEESTYDCRAPLVINGHAFHNWQSGAGRAVTATDTVVSSWNVCAIRIAQDAGSAVTRAALARFGLTPTWNDGESDALQLAHTALGNTEEIKLAQLTNAFATLANQGRVPGDEAKVVSAETAQAVSRTMIASVRRGTGKKAAIAGVTVAGKTGTSTVVTAGNETQLSLFGGFAPAEHPAYAVFVIVEDGVNRDGEKLGGGAAAAPTFREIVRRSLSLRE